MDVSIVLAREGIKLLDVAQGCRIILQDLNNRVQRSRLDQQMLLPEQVADILNVKVSETLPIIEFLEEEGYIKCGHPIGQSYSWVKLTRPGMQLVRNTDQFDYEFPMSPSFEDYPGIQAVHTRDESPSLTLDERSTGTNLTPELLQEIDEWLTEVTPALQNQDDRPLRQFLSELILKGGIEGTLAGVKALLKKHGARI